jgi:hypothetical protein
MLYDGEDIINSHVLDIKKRVGSLKSANGKMVYAYTQEEFLNKAKKMLFPAIGIFFISTTTLNPITRRSTVAEIIFNLIIVDDTKGNISDGLDAEATRILLAAIRKELHHHTSKDQKVWSFLAELPFDVGEKNKVGYLQRWSAIVTET